MPVSCPYCNSTLEGGHLEVVGWGQAFGLKLRWQRTCAAPFESRKLLGSRHRRPAGVCPACGAVVIAPLARPRQEPD